MFLKQYKELLHEVSVANLTKALTRFKNRRIVGLKNAFYNKSDINNVKKLRKALSDIEGSKYKLQDLGLDPKVKEDQIRRVIKTQVPYRSAQARFGRSMNTMLGIQGGAAASATGGTYLGVKEIEKLKEAEKEANKSILRKTYEKYTKKNK